MLLFILFIFVGLPLLGIILGNSLPNVKEREPKNKPKNNLNFSNRKLVKNINSFDDQEFKKQLEALGFDENFNPIIKEDENLTHQVVEKTKHELYLEKHEKINQKIIEKKKLEENIKVKKYLNSKEIEDKEKFSSIEKAKEIKIHQSLADKLNPKSISIEKRENLDLEELEHNDELEEYLSTTKIGKIFGVKARPELFSYLVKENILLQQNNKYELTEKGKLIGKYSVAPDGGEFVTWNLDKIHNIVETYLKNSSISLDDFNSLYHLTHLENLESIFDKGLYCHSHKHEYIDVSNIDVNSRRDKIENIHKNKIHDYVPFYFNVKNAMLYAVQKRVGEHVVILEMDKSLCYLPYTIFCDRNAATYEANFTPFKKDLNEYEWKIIFSENWTDNGVQNLVQKQKMMAECLVKAHVSQSYIKVVHCQTIEIAYTVRNLANQYCMDIDIRVSPELFF